MTEQQSHGEHHQGTGQNDISNNLQKLAFYNAGIMYLRRPEAGGVILEPFGGLGRGAISAVEGFKHFVCELEEDRAVAFSERWPDADITCGDNLEWLDSGFYSDLDVVCIDLDASLDPFDALQVFLRHAKLERYCVTFVTWGFRRSERLKADWKAGKKHTRESIYRRAREIVIAMAESAGVSVKSLGMAVPPPGGSNIVIYSAFSLVRKGGVHVEGEIAGETQELKVDKKAADKLERLDLEKMDPAKRARVLALLQYTPEEIRAYEESGDPLARATLEGEAEYRNATFAAAMSGSAPALKLWARVIDRRRFQERLQGSKQTLRRLTGREDPTP